MVTDTLDAATSARVIVKPPFGRVVLFTGLRALAVLAVVAVVVAGGHAYYRDHAEKAEARALRQLEINRQLAGVITRSQGHVVYAPTGWGAGQYPLVHRGGLYSRGTYAGAKVNVWQVPARNITRSHRPPRSLSTPESLCRFPAHLKGNRDLKAQMARMRCLRVPARHAQVRILPDFPRPGMADVRLALALDEKGRYLNVWVVDEAGEIAKHPVAWAAGFIDGLKPYDLAGYSVDDIYQARVVNGWY